MSSSNQLTPTPFFLDFIRERHIQFRCVSLIRILAAAFDEVRSSVARGVVISSDRIPESRMWSSRSILLWCGRCSVKGSRPRQISALNLSIDRSRTMSTASLKEGIDAGM
jgi:hypothetical protein